MGGTPTVTVGGTPTVSISGGTATFAGSLGAGSAFIGYTGISADGTAVADILSLTDGTAIAVGLYDADGAQVTLAKPIAISATPTLTTVTYGAGRSDGHRDVVR